MNKKKNRSLLCLMLAVLMLSLSACGANDDGADQEDNTEVLLPISINDKEIKVGETTLQTLLDEGFEVSWVDENYERITIDPSTQLEANSYYTGGSIRLNDNIFAQISFVTEEEAIPLGEAVIARLEFYMHSEDDPAVLSKIEFDGVPVTELTREKAGEMYPDWTGDEVMWLKYGLEYKYDLNFDMTSGQMTKFSVEREYDVDWSGDNS